ncbi:MAG: hypothetical protein K8T90_20765 [Planctomycetes bacterium]|nr:hypothetical protein [Planctomycetota bacterium]
MRRPGRMALAALLGAVVAVAALPSPQADAVPSGGVLGTWKLKLKIDGFGARASAQGAGAATVDSQRAVGDAVLVIRPRDAQVNDGIVTIEVALDAATAQTVLGRATPGTPAFRGTAAILGDSLAVIDSGQPNYVNAITLRFAPGGRKLAGSWIAVFPASEPTLGEQKFAAGVSATVTGTRKLRDAPRDR